MSPDYLPRVNVLVVSFGEDPKNDTNAYEALTELKRLDAQGQIEIAAPRSSRATPTTTSRSRARWRTSPSSVPPAAA